MSYSDFERRPPRTDSSQGWSLLEALIDARARAEQQYLADVRRNVDAGLRLAEEMSRQGTELGRSLLDQFRRALSGPGGGSATPGWSQGTYNPYRETDPYEPADPDVDSAVWPSSHRQASAVERPPALRLVLPAGTRDVGVPIELRNHRDVPDFVSLSANPLRLEGAAVIPSEFVRFEPDTLEVPPHGERSVQVLLHLGSNLAPGIEYWSEIVIAGAEVRRIPLVVQILPDQ